MKDGLSNTFMIGEDLPDKSWFSTWAWGDQGITCAIPPNVRRATGGSLAPEYFPEDWINGWGAKSRHVPGGVQFAFGDGHVHFITGEIDRVIYRALGTRAGREHIEEIP